MTYSPHQPRTPCKPCIQPETPSSLSYRPVHPLNHSILLWCLANSIVPLNAMLLTKFLELRICVLSTIIRSETFNHPPGLILYFRFPQFKLGKRLRLVP